MDLGSHVLESREQCWCSVPNFEPVDIFFHHFLQMCSQCPAIDLRAAAFLAYALVDVKNNTRESIFVDVDFLLVGDFSNLAMIDMSVALALTI